MAVGFQFSVGTSFSTEREHGEVRFVYPSVSCYWGPLVCLSLPFPAQSCFTRLARSFLSRSRSAIHKQERGIALDMKGESDCPHCPSPVPSLLSVIEQFFFSFCFFGTRPKNPNSFRPRRGSPGQGLRHGS